MIKNIAIFPSGTEIGLEINNALKYIKDINIIGFSSSQDHTRFVYKKYIDNLPSYNEKDFIERLNSAIKENNIDYIYPAHDDVLLFLTQNKEKINTKIITSEFETVNISRSKIKTYEYFKEEEFIPKIYNSINNVKDYPVFIKPDIGQGAKGAKLVKNEEELNFEYEQNHNIVISEYLPGDEYTIDCFTDINRQLRFVGARDRKRIKCGISVNSESVEVDNEILNIANTINNKLKFNGAWFFQLKRDIHNKLKLLEIAARIPGTMGLSRNRGINFPLLTIYNNLGLKVEIIKNNYNIELDRAFINRYRIDINYNTVYVDFDDTIVINGKVNKYLIMFMYQLLGENKKIILLTKHRKNIKESLDKYKICVNLFDEIIQINENDEKGKYIKDKEAIFIDDSFSERKRIHDELGIPVFDLDEVEALLDWKVEQPRNNILEGEE